MAVKLSKPEGAMLTSATDHYIIMFSCLAFMIFTFHTFISIMPARPLFQCLFCISLLWLEIGAIGAGSRLFTLKEASGLMNSGGLGERSNIKWITTSASPRIIAE